MKKWKKWEEETNSLEYNSQPVRRTIVCFSSSDDWSMRVSVSRVKLMRFFHCRSFAIPIDAPDVVREAAPGPLQHSRSQMDCEFDGSRTWAPDCQFLALQQVWPEYSSLQVGFFRQFFASVTKVDYLTMRQGFINVLNISPIAAAATWWFVSVVSFWC